MKYPFVPKGFEQYAITGTYPGILRDMIVVLGVCMMEDDEVSKAQLDPDEAYRRAEKWAKSKGILERGKPYFEAKAMFEQIMVEVHSSRATPEDSQGGSSEDDEDDGGNG